MRYLDIVNLTLSYADRSDVEVSSRIDDFITLTEARVNRLLEVRKMATRSIISTVRNQNYYGLPPNFAGMRDIEIYGSESDSSSKENRQTLQYLTPEQMNQHSTYNDATQIYYTIVADQIQIFPAQNGRSMEIVYYQTLPNLNELNPTNWLSETAPDGYVFGILTEINAFVKDAPTSGLWNERFFNVMKELSANDAVDGWSGQSLKVRVT